VKSSTNSPESSRSPSLYSVERTLRRHFGQPRHGNKRNPLSELFYILLSLQTSESNCKRSYSALRRTFPQWSRLANASRNQVRLPIDCAGFGRQRASKIQRIVKRIIKDKGKLSLAFLEAMETNEAEEYLVSLPGIGKKTARCILMYSLERSVFPLDTHCARVLKRLGFHVPDGSLRKCEDRIQNLIPPRLRYSLHVTMISLGRQTCTSKSPNCEICPLRRICPTGIASLSAMRDFEC
jgi:endonuclease-3